LTVPRGDKLPPVGVYDDKATIAELSKPSSAK